MRAIGARAIAYSVVALLAAAAFIFTPPIHGRQITPAVSVVTRPAVPDTVSVADTLRSGETLSQLFARAGVAPTIAASALRAAPFVDERRVIAGTVVTVKHVSTDSTGATEIALQPAIDHIVHLRRTGDQWSAQDEKLPWTSDTIVVSGTIHTNLYAAMDAGAQTLPKHARKASRGRSPISWTIAST